MYGKFYYQAFKGSMYGAGANVFAVWAYIIALAVKSRVDINPLDIANHIGMTQKEVEDAVEYLCAPDPNSRTPSNEGRRMIREGSFQYFIPNHEIFTKTKSPEELRAYYARVKREWRAQQEATKKAKEGLTGGLTGEGAYLEALNNGDVAGAERAQDLATDAAMNRIKPPTPNPEESNS